MYTTGQSSGAIEKQEIKRPSAGCDLNDNMLAKLNRVVGREPAGPLSLHETTGVTTFRL